ncbi:nitrogenase stabilizing/protective protein NifW [Bradyrhizobium sp. RDM4]|uniref:nitrogenase stabilizing/protective protein NifW n=1 Tax=Bradyrhizobium sp. RDM4 TaxID=3378765 RepID=UPI0038FC7C8C
MTMDGILARLNKASAAEDFFALLGVEYDAKIVDVARLHILRRMGQYLAGEELTGASDPEIAARCKATLERAYADFVTSSPIEQRVFKVLKDAAAPQAKKHPALVQLGSLE